jgi:hypothetical protein
MFSTQAKQPEFSRVPEIIDPFIGLQRTVVSGEGGKPTYHYQKIMPGRIDNRRRRGRDSDDDDEDLFNEEDEDEMLMKKYIDKRTGLVNLDLIQPYVPERSEVLESVWI